MMKSIKKLFILSVFVLSVCTQIYGAAPTPQKQLYELPYPGILPTHPLYFLKNLRDSIIESLITDPGKKVEFYVLQADKKLQMATMLTDSNKSSESTRILAQSYAHQKKAVDTAESSKDTIKRFIIEHTIASLEKHKEIYMKRQWDENRIQLLLDRIQALLKPL